MGVLVDKLINFYATECHGWHMFCIENISDNTGVHDGRKHAGVVCSHLTNAITGQLRSSCIITTTNYHNYLRPSRYNHS